MAHGQVGGPAGDPRSRADGPRPARRVGGGYGARQPAGHAPPPGDRAGARDLTFTNGEFYLIGLPAGDYDVSIPADVLKLLGLTEEVPALTLHVPKPSDRATQLPELLIRLRPSTPAD
jgi:hypothetical protein